MQLSHCLLSMDINKLRFQVISPLQRCPAREGNAVQTPESRPARLEESPQSHTQRSTKSELQAGEVINLIPARCDFVVFAHTVEK